MIRHVPILLGLSVLAVAGWTYNVNYETRAALDRLSGLRAEIAEERENLQVLRVEWAYLNAPDRLLRLVAQHQDELALVPLTPEALGSVAAVPYPPDARPPAPQPDAEALIAAAPQAGGSTAAPGTGAGEGEHGTAAMLAGLEPGVPVPEDAGAAGIASADIRPTDPLPTGVAPAGPDAMRAAVAAALAEVGIAVRAGPAEPQPALVALAGGVPMPQARPAGWTPQ